MLCLRNPIEKCVLDEGKVRKDGKVTEQIKDMSFQGYVLVHSCMHQYAQEVDK